MKPIHQSIEALKNLELSKYPRDEIQSIFNEIGRIGFVEVIFHKGKVILRSRPNYNGERFEKKSDYSFKPQECNKTYQRASTPHSTMFYGTVVPEKIQPGELDNMRVIGIAETIPMMKDNQQSGYQKISFGKWVVAEDIRLIAIVYKESFSKESSYTKELADAYKGFLYSTSLENQERSLSFTSFLADEFSKEKISGDYEYMISALFSELVIQKGLDGVLYPSVRVSGRGFNIAITPEATNKLKLIAAGECSVYKLREDTVVGNDAIVELDGTEETFILRDIERNEKEYLARLGVTSIEDLR
ncbi:MAG: RES domain-containing protein [Saprospirales bacterium]|nr:MAG: RES domain-containing protein [Saprospirales bacterium]